MLSFLWLTYGLHDIVPVAGDGLFRLELVPFYYYRLLAERLYTLLWILITTNAMAKVAREVVFFKTRTLDAWPKNDMTSWLLRPLWIQLQFLFFCYNLLWDSRDTRWHGRVSQRKYWKQCGGNNLNLTFFSDAFCAGVFGTYTYLLGRLLYIDLLRDDDDGNGKVDGKWLRRVHMSVKYTFCRCRWPKPESDLQKKHWSTGLATITWPGQQQHLNKYNAITNCAFVQRTKTEVEKHTKV